MMPALNWILSRHTLSEFDDCEKWKDYLHYLFILFLLDSPLQEAWQA